MLGTPSAADLDFVPSGSARQAITNMNKRPPVDLRSVFKVCCCHISVGAMSRTSRSADLGAAERAPKE